MNQTRPIAIALLLFLASCHNNKPAPGEVADKQTAQSNKQDKTDTTIESDELKSVIAEIKRILQKQAAAPQVYSADSLKGRIVGKYGTLINVIKGDLETIDGQPVTGDVRVELHELANKWSFASFDAPTVSDGRMLVSGGVYYVGMTSNGKQLKLKPGRKLEMRLPKAGDGMSLFYGQRDASGMMNWKLADQPLTKTPSDAVRVSYRAPSGESYWLEDNPVVQRLLARLQVARAEMKRTSMNVPDMAVDSNGVRHITMKAEDFRKLNRLKFDEEPDRDSAAIKKEIVLLEDSLAKQGKNLVLAATLYDQIQVSQLGWINCDRFLNQQNIIDLAYKMGEGESVKAAKVFVVFRDINSIMEGVFTAGGESNFVRRIPSGATVTAVALSIRDKKVLLSKVTTKTNAAEPIVFNMREASENELKNLFR